MTPSAPFSPARSRARHPTRALSVAALGVAIVVGSPPEASAAFRLTRVIGSGDLAPGSTTETVQHIEAAPALVGDALAFLGTGSESGLAVYSIVGGVGARPVDSSGSFPLGFSLPSFDGANVSYLKFGVSNVNPPGVYKVLAPAFTRQIVANTTTAIPNGTGTFESPSTFTSIENGKVVFVGDGPGFFPNEPVAQQGVYTDLNGALERVADLTTAVPDGGPTGDNTFCDHCFLTDPVMNGGHVVFGSGLRSPTAGPGGFGIYQWNGTTKALSTLFDTSEAVPGITTPFLVMESVNADGATIVFVGSSNRSGVYRKANGTIDVVTDTTTTVPDHGVAFNRFGFVSLDAGAVAFEGQFFDPSFTNGIYTTLGGELDTVVEGGDMIDGKQLALSNSLLLGKEALSDGTLAFAARFTDGTSAIYLAEPIDDVATPTPTATPPPVATPTPSTCAAAGGDADTDGICDDVDNCPADANGDQLDSDCDDPSFVPIPGACDAPAAGHAGCCDGGDACDACPAQADNTRCDPAGSAAASLGAGGGMVHTADGSVIVDVPPGALADDTTISVTENGVARESFTLRSSGVLSVSLRPENQHFLTPVVVSFHWHDRDDDGRVDLGVCLPGTGAETDLGLACDANADCHSGDCSVTTGVPEATLVLKRNNDRFSRDGFGPTAAPFDCASHLANGCATAAASCADAAGTGRATVANCCDPAANTWTFQTCDFSELLLGTSAAALIPGKGAPRTDCIAEWAVDNPLSAGFVDAKGLPSATQTCTDGDAICDGDGTANGICVFEVGVCLNVADPRLARRGAPRCSATDVASWVLRRPRLGSRRGADAANAAALLDTMSAIAPATRPGKRGNEVAYTPPVATDACSALTAVAVPLGGRRGDAVGKTELTARAKTSDGRPDTDRLKLVCLPAASSP